MLGSGDFCRIEEEKTIQLPGYNIGERWWCWYFYSTKHIKQTQYISEPVRKEKVKKHCWCSGVNTILFIDFWSVVVGEGGPCEGNLTFKSAKPHLIWVKTSADLRQTSSVPGHSLIVQVHSCSGSCGQASLLRCRCTGSAVKPRCYYGQPPCSGSKFAIHMFSCTCAWQSRCYET